MRKRFAAAGYIATLILVLLLCLTQAAYAQPPGMPHQFVGNVTANGNPASGATVSARVGGSEVATATTDAQGSYSLQVSGSNGATVEFYVNNVKAQPAYTLSSGAITNLNLTAGGSSGSGSTPPPPPPPPPPAPNPVTSESEPTPPTSTTPASESQSQQQQSASATAKTITAAVLGSAGSIRLSNAGALQSDTVLSSADGAVKLSFKANTTVNIPEGQSLTVTLESAPPAPPANTEVVKAFKFTPSGSEFQPAITLILKYDPTSLPAGVTEESLFVACWDGSKWSAISSTADTQAKVITAQISHFSIFAILGVTGGAPAPRPASFIISSFNVSPTSVEVGEPVTITAAVTNSGGSQGSYTAVLKVNGAVEAEKEISLSPGETKTVTFTIRKESAGKYNIAIDGKSGSFQVGTAGKSEGPSMQLMIGFGVCGILIIVLIVLIVRRLTA